MIILYEFADILKASESSPTKAESQEASQKKTQESKESKKESESKSLNEGKEEKKTEEKGVEKEREEAATRIQAAFRGHHARKSMKETESSTKQTGTKSNSEPTKEELQQEFRADDKGECHVRTLEIVPKGEAFNFRILLFLPISSGPPLDASFVSRSGSPRNLRLLDLLCVHVLCNAVVRGSYVTACQPGWIISLQCCNL